MYGDENYDEFIGADSDDNESLLDSAKYQFSEKHTPKLQTFQYNDQMLMKMENMANEDLNNGNIDIAFQGFTQCLQRYLELIGSLYRIEFIEYFKKIVKRIMQFAIRNLNEQKITLALKILDKCKELVNSGKFGNFPDILAYVYNHIACCYRRFGKLDKAINLLQKALDLNSNYERLESAGITHINITAIMSQIGNHEKALDHAKRAIFECSFDLINSNNNNNNNNNRDNEDEESEDEFRRKIIMLAIAYNNLGQEENYLEKYDSALISYYKAYKTLDENLGSGHELTIKFKKNYEDIKTKCINNKLINNTQLSNISHQRPSSLGPISTSYANNPYAATLFRNNAKSNNKRIIIRAMKHIKPKSNFIESKGQNHETSLLEYSQVSENKKSASNGITYLKNSPRTTLTKKAMLTPGNMMIPTHIQPPRAMKNNFMQMPNHKLEDRSHDSTPTKLSPLRDNRPLHIKTNSPNHIRKYIRGVSLNNKDQRYPIITMTTTNTANTSAHPNTMIANIKRIVASNDSYNRVANKSFNGPTDANSTGVKLYKDRVSGIKNKEEHQHPGFIKVNPNDSRNNKGDKAKISMNTNIANTKLSNRRDNFLKKDLETFNQITEASEETQNISKDFTINKTTKSSGRTSSIDRKMRNLDRKKKLNDNIRHNAALLIQKWLKGRLSKLSFKHNNSHLSYETILVRHLFINLENISSNTCIMPKLILIVTYCQQKNILDFDLKNLETKKFYHLRHYYVHHPKYDKYKSIKEQLRAYCNDKLKEMYIKDNKLIFVSSPIFVNQQIESPYTESIPNNSRNNEEDDNSRNNYESGNQEDDRYDEDSRNNDDTNNNNNNTSNEYYHSQLESLNDFKKMIPTASNVDPDDYITSNNTDKNLKSSNRLQGMRSMNKIRDSNDDNNNNKSSHNNNVEIKNQVDEDKKLNSAAIMIQKHVKGKLIRKQGINMKEYKVIFNKIFWYENMELGLRIGKKMDDLGRLYVCSIYNFTLGKTFPELTIPIELIGINPSLITLDKVLKAINISIVQNLVTLKTNIQDLFNKEDLISENENNTIKEDDQQHNTLNSKYQDKHEFKEDKIEYQDQHHHHKDSINEYYNDDYEQSHEFNDKDDAMSRRSQIKIKSTIGNNDNQEEIIEDKDYYENEYKDYIQKYTLCFGDILYTMTLEYLSNKDQLILNFYENEKFKQELILSIKDIDMQTFEFSSFLIRIDYLLLNRIKYEDSLFSFEKVSKIEDHQMEKLSNVSKLESEHNQTRKSLIIHDDILHDQKLNSMSVKSIQSQNKRLNDSRNSSKSIKRKSIQESHLNKMLLNSNEFKKSLDSSRRFEQIHSQHNSKVSILNKTNQSIRLNHSIKSNHSINALEGEIEYDKAESIKNEPIIKADSSFKAGSRTDLDMHKKANNIDNEVDLECKKEVNVDKSIDEKVEERFKELVEVRAEERVEEVVVEERVEERGEDQVEEPAKERVETQVETRAEERIEEQDEGRIEEQSKDGVEETLIEEVEEGMILYSNQEKEAYKSKENLEESINDQINPRIDSKIPSQEQQQIHTKSKDELQMNSLNYPDEDNYDKYYWISKKSDEVIYMQMDKNDLEDEYKPKISEIENIDQIIEQSEYDEEYNNRELYKENSEKVMNGMNGNGKGSGGDIRRDERKSSRKMLEQSLEVGDKVENERKSSRQWLEQSLEEGDKTKSERKSSRQRLEKVLEERDKAESKRKPSQQRLEQGLKEGDEAKNGRKSSRQQLEQNLEERDDAKSERKSSRQQLEQNLEEGDKVKNKRKPSQQRLDQSLEERDEPMSERKSSRQQLDQGFEEGNIAKSERKSSRQQLEQHNLEQGNKTYIVNNESIIEESNPNLMNINIAFQANKTSNKEDIDYIPDLNNIKDNTINHIITITPKNDELIQDEKVYNDNLQDYYSIRKEQYDNEERIESLRLMNDNEEESSQNQLEYNIISVKKQESIVNLSNMDKLKEEEEEEREVEMKVKNSIRSISNLARDINEPQAISTQNLENDEFEENVDIQDSKTPINETDIDNDDKANVKNDLINEDIERKINEDEEHITYEKPVNDNEDEHIHVIKKLESNKDLNENYSVNYEDLDNEDNIDKAEKNENNNKQNDNLEKFEKESLDPNVKVKPAEEIEEVEVQEERVADLVNEYSIEYEKSINHSMKSDGKYDEYEQINTKLDEMNKQNDDNDDQIRNEVEYNENVYSQKSSKKVIKHDESFIEKTSLRSNNKSDDNLLSQNHNHHQYEQEQEQPEEIMMEEGEEVDEEIYNNNNKSIEIENQYEQEQEDFQQSISSTRNNELLKQKSPSIEDIKRNPSEIINESEYIDGVAGEEYSIEYEKSNREQIQQHQQDEKEENYYDKKVDDEVYDNDFE